MSVILLNVVLSLIVIGIAVFLTIVAITCIIVSLVRASSAKKKGKKTSKAGLWIGIIMLITPWILVVVMMIISRIYDAYNNRWKVDRGIIAEAVLSDDAGDLYDMMAEDVTDRNDLSLEDLEGFLEECNIENDSLSDLESYSEFDSARNHYRPYISRENGRAQLCFQYTMYDVNSDGGELFITGVDGDPEDESYVGIYYIMYSCDDGYIEFGEKPPKEH